MSRRGACSCAAAIALLVGACAKQTDAETRAAFEAAANPASTVEGTPRLRPGPRTRRPTVDTKTTWNGVSALIEAAIALLGGDADLRALGDAAAQWCAVTPVPKATEAGPSYECFPRDPLEVGRRSFTLELSASGLVGLHMDDLDEATSVTIADQARGAVARLCATPMSMAPVTDAKAPRFHTCPVDGGSTLAVGHARSTTGPGWFVTITVLGEVVRASAQ